MLTNLDGAGIGQLQFFFLFMGLRAVDFYKPRNSTFEYYHYALPISGITSLELSFLLGLSSCIFPGSFSVSEGGVWVGDLVGC